MSLYYFCSTVYVRHSSLLIFLLFKGNYNLPSLGTDLTLDKGPSMTEFWPPLQTSQCRSFILSEISFITSCRTISLVYESQNSLSFLLTVSTSLRALVGNGFEVLSYSTLYDFSFSCPPPLLLKPCYSPHVGT